MDSLELDTIIDFRCPIEIFEARNYIPKNVKYIKTPCFKRKDYPYITVCMLSKLQIVAPNSDVVEAIPQNKYDCYKEFVECKAFNKIFESLDKGETFIFHCTEGKDRTGIAAALIELSLGRTEEQALAEYMRSQEFRPNKNRQSLKLIGLSDELIDVIAYAESVHEDLFKLTFDTAKEKYGTIDNYLEKVFDITKNRRQKWQTLYLE